MDEFDVIVIGGGPAGENVAQYAIEGSGRTAAIVEAELLGGECSYFACMPSKALLRPLDIAAAARSIGGLTNPRIEVQSLLERRDIWVSHYNDSGQTAWADSAGIKLIRGHGRLSGELQVLVDGQEGERQLDAREAIVLATGSQAVIPAPFADLQPWTSRDATGVVEIPDRLAIIGGGVVACEAARWMVALGSTVTMIVRGDGLLERNEPFAGELVAQSLRAEGIDLRFEAEVESATRTDASATGLGKIHGGAVRLKLRAGETLSVDEVLVVTGRRPATEDLGLASVGLDPADIHGRTSGGALPAWLYVVGDLNAEAALTHWGKYQARQVGSAIADKAEGKVAADGPAKVPVPQVVFTDPQVASVGPTLAQARAAGQQVRAIDADLTDVAGALLMRDDLVGRVRLVVQVPTNRLLGATFVGPDVADLLHSATVAIVGEMTLDRLRHAVPSYPTASEIWLRLLESH